MTPPEGFESTESTGTEEGALDTGTEDTGAEDTGNEYDESHVEGDSDGTDGTESTETGTEEPEVVDPYADFGGRETIEKAHQMYQAAQSQDGITRLFIEAGQALGFSGRDLDAFVTKAMGQEDSSGADETDEDDDRYITAKELREREAKREKAAAEKEQAAQVETARSTVSNTFKDLGVDPQDPTADVILKLGDKHLKGNLAPENVAAAVRQGHAEFLALVEKQAKEYSRKKADTRKRVPKAPSGGAAPSTPEPTEPKDTAEAVARVRKMLREGN